MKRISTVRTLCAIVVAALAVPPIVCLSGAASDRPPSSRPAESPESDDSWQLLVTYNEFPEAGKIKAVFIASVFNVGDQEQTLFTPGFVGPILYGERDARLEDHATPRRGTRSRLDFVTLRPSEGFSRILKLRTRIEDRTWPLDSVGAYLMIYKKSYEGHSDKVEKSLWADFYRVERPKGPGKQKK